MQMFAIPCLRLATHSFGEEDPLQHTNQPTSHPLNAHEGCAAEAEQAGVAAAAAAAEHQPQ